MKKALLLLKVIGSVLFVIGLLFVIWLGFLIAFGSILNLQYTLAWILASISICIISAAFVAYLCEEDAELKHIQSQTDLVQDQMRRVLYNLSTEDKKEIENNEKPSV